MVLALVMNKLVTLMHYLFCIGLAVTRESSLWGKKLVGGWNYMMFCTIILQLAVFLFVLANDITLMLLNYMDKLCFASFGINWNN